MSSDKTIEHRVDVERYRDLERENAALRDRLAATETDLALRLEYDKTLEQLANKYVQERHDAETRLAAAEHAASQNGAEAIRAAEQIRSMAQREQQARAIIERVSAGNEDGDDGASSFLRLNGTDGAERVVTQARAWLADRAEQQAAAQEVK